MAVKTSMRVEVCNLRRAKGHVSQTYLGTSALSKWICPNLGGTSHFVPLLEESFFFGLFFFLGQPCFEHLLNTFCQLRSLTALNNRPLVDDAQIKPRSLHPSRSEVAGGAGPGGKRQRWDKWPCFMNPDLGDEHEITSA